MLTGTGCLKYTEERSTGSYLFEPAASTKNNLVITYVCYLDVNDQRQYKLSTESIR